MLSIIGAILLIGGSAAFGFSSVMRLRARSRNLQMIASALGVMQSEICDRLTPMPELLANLAVEMQQPVSLLFKNAEESMKSGLGALSFAEIWKQAVTETTELMLTAQEAGVLSELGLWLGRYNPEEQKTSLQYTQRRIEEFMRRADNERDTNSKTHAFLGVAAGIFAVVILI